MFQLSSLSDIELRSKKDSIRRTGGCRSSVGVIVAAEECPRYMGSKIVMDNTSLPRTAGDSGVKLSGLLPYFMLKPPRYLRRIRVSG